MTLLPCPFCGGEGILDFKYNPNDYWYYVTCDTDFCPSFNDQGWNRHSTMEEAIKIWNSRPIEEHQQQQITALQGELEQFRQAVYSLKKLRYTEKDLQNITERLRLANELTESLRVFRAIPAGVQKALDAYDSHTTGGTQSPEVLSDKAYWDQFNKDKEVLPPTQTLAQAREKGERV